ncbi:putative dehydrogenase [Rhodopirellula rubra]|uniref:Putative dehydrogenase n=1 Tax=Aporhodopirellula rubra TaxID=980271 RepID=A0A7W5H516_9BACT|nr:Gfo/Idh/MocA family oxidoreductase [Aporhodopirellula rubra]MBB3205748.1 putative dehydrogenase [Aporhodopirellula rubra]
MTTLTRRQFLTKTSMAASAVGVAASCGVHASVADAASRSPNEELRVAVVGLNGRGRSHIDGFSKASGSNVVAFCDADKSVLEKHASNFDSGRSTKLKRFADYREMLEDDEIDVIAIATPNHWHSLMTIDACVAGKHVYVEKPVCHSVWEGRKMIEAMQKYNRIVGAGFQNRSDTGLRAAIPWIQDGNLGKITAVRGLCNRNRNSIGVTSTPTRPPAELDYDLWLGPAADQPIYRPQIHYDWHWDWNTGNGDMGNQGPHEMDLVQWVLGDPGHPVSVRSIGGRFAWNDGGNTPNMQVATFDFGNGIPVVFEVRNIHNKERVGQFKDGPSVGIVVTCEEGEYRGGRGGGAVYDKSGKKIKDFKGDSGSKHMSYFTQAVRANDPGKVRSTLESAFHSSCMSHLANISVRTGEGIHAAEVVDRVGDDAATREVIERFSTQLSHLNVDFAKTPWRVGTALTFDAATERFTAGDNASKANDLLKRDYRSPFIIPDSI